MARAVEARGNIFTLSGWSHTLPDKVAELAPSAPLFCHFTKSMVRNLEMLPALEAMGYLGVVITIDNTINSRRRETMRRDFSMPPHTQFVTLLKYAAIKPNPGESFSAYHSRSNAFDISWEDIH